MENTQHGYNIIFCEKKKIQENILHIGIELRKICPIRVKCNSMRIFFFFFNSKKLNEIYFYNKMKFYNKKYLVLCDISNEKNE